MKPMDKLRAQQFATELNRLCHKFDVALDAFPGITHGILITPIVGGIKYTVEGGRFLLLVEDKDPENSGLLPVVSNPSQIEP